METQVKERLTGAVILVTLIVLLVPELLTGGPGKESPPADVAAPSVGTAGEAAVRTYSIDLVQGGVKRQQAPPDEPDLSARAVTKPQAAGEPDATVEPAKVVAEQVSAQPQPSSVASQQGSAAKRVAEPLVEQFPPPVASKPTPAVAKPAQAPKVEPKPASTAASRVAAESPPKEAASSAMEKGWAVQLGSFASRENAQRLARQLKGKGYSAYVLGGGGSSGKLYRVRVGPEPDRAAANALAEKLRTAGQKGSVVSQP